MANPPQSPPTDNDRMVPSQTQNGGCLPSTFFILYLIWLGLISLITLPGMWLLENLLFEGSLGLPDVRGWVGLAYLLGVGIPIAVLVWLPGVLRGFYRVTGFSLAIGLMMLPARWLFLTEFQTAALIVIGSLGIGIWVCLKLLSRHPEGGRA